MFLPAAQSSSDGKRSEPEVALGPLEMVIATGKFLIRGFEQQVKRTLPKRPWDIWCKLDLFISLRPLRCRPTSQGALRRQLAESEWLAELPSPCSMRRGSLRTCFLLGKHSTERHWPPREEADPPREAVLAGGARGGLPGSGLKAVTEP